MEIETLPVEFVALDLETTGLFAETDRVVELGAVRFDGSGRELGRFQRLVNPGRRMSPAAQAVHGLGDAELAGAPPARDVLPAFLQFLGDPATTRLLAHNAAFDAGFLGHELARAGIPIPAHGIIDTLALARRFWPSAPSHKLATLATLVGLNGEDAHRALGDSLRVMGLWLAVTRDGAPAGPLVTYPIADPRRPFPAPGGWERLASAMADGLTVCLEYDGGTRGPGPRHVTPRRFAHRGGVAYLVAFCHHDAFEKSFRLDRVRRYEVVEVVELADRQPAVATTAMPG